jgi:tape measure domain-containing protein
VAYRADIEIAVRGAQELKRLQNEVSATSKLVDQLNSYIQHIGDGGIVRSINNLRSVVADAGAAFSKAALGTEEATTAATKYVQATSALNDGLRERAALLKNIADQERRARLAASGIRETTQYAGPIGPGPASPVGSLVGQKSPVEERIRRTIRARQEEKDLQEALLQLEQRSARLANEELQARGAIAAATAKGVNAAKFAAGQTPGALMLPAFQERGLQILNNNVKLNESNLRIEQALNGERARGVRFLEKQSAEEQRQIELGILGQRTNRLPGQGMAATGNFPVSGPIPLSQYGSLRRGTATSAFGQTLRSRASGAVGNALIGGAFPLLFGQGKGAAAGGAIGGLVGGAFGGVGGFAGSLVGTLLGDIASRGQAIKQLGDDIGFSVQQTKQLSDAFKVANTDVDKFTAVIQNIRGVGLALEDQAKAIQLVTRLTEAYGGSFEKTGNSITSALESGKVTQATLNQLTSQGINIQQALADKYKVSRSEILKMAKDGEISVQSLIDTLVEVANAGTAGATKVKSSYEETATAMTNAFTNATTGINTSFTSIQNTVVTTFDRIIRAVSPALIKLAEITGKVISLGAYVAELGVKFAAAFYSIPGTIQAVGTAISNMIPGLSAIYWTLSSIDKLRGGGGKNRGGLATSLNLNAGMDGANWPAGIPRPGTPVQSFTVPSEFGPTGGAGKKGPKPPEDRTALLREDLQAMELMSITQDGIRDALFEGNKELAIRLEYDQKVADINRDTAKALLNANYETEKTVIRAQEVVRLKDAELERLDKLRQLEREITEEYYSRAGLSTRNLTQREGAGAFDLTLNLDPNDPINQRFDEMKKNLNELQDPINMAVRGAEGIGNAFSNAFQSLATGAQSAQQALVTFFKGVGDAFISMATEIIAQMVVMFTFKQLLGLFGGSSSSLFKGAGPVSGASVFGSGQAGFNPTAFAPGVGFASGGFVTGPTRAVVGEGGESEYIIPASKMSAAMSRYAAGARGSAVIPGNGTAGAGGTTSGNGTTIDVRYTVERINSVDYVTADQFQRGMQQAARQGAEQGERRALGRLQNSPATRRRVGV